MARGGVAGIIQPAFPQRQAAAADASVQIIAKLVQCVDFPVEMLAKTGTDPVPVRLVRRALIGQGLELGSDLLDCETELLGDEDKGQPADIGAEKSPLPASISRRAHQAFGFVKPNCGHR